MYTGGCYFFNKTTEEWEGVGVSVDPGGSNLFSSCSSDHLTSFGTGFFPEINTIDFEFMMVELDYADNVTILMVLIVTIVLFLITLIWAKIRDMRDVKEQKPHWMKDNLKEDHYFYEVLVQTGPMLSHGTESKVQMILTGEDNATQVRTLSDPTKQQLFKKGKLDTFLMSVDKPLGHLQYLKIWHDNSGIREMQPWYLSYMIIHDIQTGEKFRFLADKWLAIDRDEFTSEIQIPVSIPEGEASIGFLFKQGIFNKLKDDHLMWSVFSRPKRSRFTRTQRVCVSMAMLYLAMLTNAMFYGQIDGYMSDPFFQLTLMLQFSWEEISVGILSSMIILPPVILIVMLFRKSIPGGKNKSRFDKVIEEAAEADLVSLPEKSYERTPNAKDKPEGWPSWCYFAGWALTVLSITVGMGLVAAYGISFGNRRTYQWLTAMMVNFFWNLFVEQPIKVAIVTMVVACIKRRPKWDQDHVDVDEHLPRIYYDPDDPEIKKFITKPKAEPPEFDPEYLEPMRFRRVQEGEMNAVIMDIIVYLIYLFMVLLVAMGNRDPNAFYMKMNLQNTLVHGGMLCNRPDNNKKCDKEEDIRTWENPFSGNTEPNPYVDFLKVREVNQWWLWVNKTLLPNVRVQNWYNDDPPYGLRGYLDDRVNRIIGYALVRQVREKLGNCRSPILMRDYIDSCTGNLLLNQYDEDYRTYCLGWQPLISENCTRMEEYEFRSAEERRAYSLNSDLRRYGGGGYELKMKGHIAKLKAKLELLQTNGWIDNRTRALITEFTVYNPQVLFVVTVFLS